MTIQGFAGTNPLIVRIADGSPIAGEHEIDSRQAVFLADGIVAVITDQDGGITKWWVPRERIDYIRQEQSAPAPEPQAPTPGGGGSGQEQPPAPQG